MNFLPGWSADHALSAPLVAEISLQMNAGVSAGLTTYTFNSVDFGAEAASRHLILALKGGYSNRTVSACTIGGVSATQISTMQLNNNTVSLYIAAVPTGTSGSFSIQWSGSQHHCGVALFRAVNINPTPTASPTDQAAPLSQSLTIPANGVAVGYATADASAARTWTWSQMSEGFDAGYASSVGDSNYHTGAISSTAGAATRAATPSGAIGASFMLLAAFQPG